MVSKKPKQLKEHKYKFSFAKYEEISRLLLAKTQATEKNVKKKCRDDIRKLGFYISDFERPASGFTPTDLDKLRESGAIQVS